MKHENSRAYTKLLATKTCSVLRACRRLLRPGGRTAYFTIFTTPGLSKSDHRRAVRLGPRAVASRQGQAELLEAAGFTSIDVRDVTKVFLETAHRWLRHAAERLSIRPRTMGFHALARGGLMPRSTRASPVWRLRATASPR